MISQSNFPIFLQDVFLTAAKDQLLQEHIIKQAFYLLLKDIQACSTFHESHSLPPVSTSWSEC